MGKSSLNVAELNRNSREGRRTLTRWEKAKEKELTRLVLPNFDIFTNTPQAIEWRRENCSKSDYIPEIMEYNKPVLQRFYERCGVVEGSVRDKLVAFWGYMGKIQVHSRNAERLTAEQKLAITEYTFLLRNGFVKSLG
jgi:uncharacterized protein (DUF849 family)